jgi:ArsR family transcriptional regulator
MKPKCCVDKKILGETTQVADFLKVIAEENRLKILCLLRNGEQCVCDIWQFLGLPQNLASHHLRVLKDFGLVGDRKEGLRVYYSMNKKEIARFNSLLNKFLQSNGK